MNFKTLTSRTVFTGRVFSVRSDRVLLPDGQTSSLDIVDHGGAVVIIPIDASGNLVMIRQYRYAVEEELLEFPAGTLENGEAPVTCAARELREETGFAGEHFEEIGGFYLAPGYSTEFLHIFVARGLSPAPLPGDEDELLEVAVLSPTDLDRSVREGRLRDAKSLAALYLARGKLARED